MGLSAGRKHLVSLECMECGNTGLGLLKKKKRHIHYQIDNMVNTHTKCSQPLISKCLPEVPIKESDMPMGGSTIFVPFHLVLPMMLLFFKWPWIK